MQLPFSLFMAALLLPASAFAQGHFPAAGIRQIRPALHGPCELGDGMPRYGHERMAELYGAELGAGFTLTADARRVVDPGYNTDRGPAAFHALRLHWES